MASFVSRVGDHSVERWVTSREALHAATEGGARALGFDRIGRIAAGYKADIVFIDLAATHYVPCNDIANQLVFCEDGTGVESVMIGGRMVLDHGRFTTIDPAKLRSQARGSGRPLVSSNARRPRVERAPRAVRWSVLQRARGGSASRASSVGRWQNRAIHIGREPMKQSWHCV